MTFIPFPSKQSPSRSDRRACAYLRLCGVEPAEADALTTRPVEKIQDDFDEWAKSLGLITSNQPSVQPKALARAQVLLAKIPARWPRHFLQSPPTPEITAAAQAVQLQPVRPLRQTNMAPQPIDLGPVADVAHETWRTFDTWPVLRGLTTWVLFALLLIAVFYVVRF